VSLLKIVVLAVIQGLAELLPVSSSAHVVIAEKLMGLDPSAPALTLLLVLLHTGTMVAVIVYFWRDWRAAYFSSRTAFVRSAGQIVLATLLTGVIGLGLAKVVEHALLHGKAGADVEDLFSHLELVAPALFAVGVLIILADRLRPRVSTAPMTATQAGLIGAVQGLSLPFRGFSRSGATISAGLLAGVERQQAEAFSFALAVVLTPAVIVREIWRFKQHGFTTDSLQSALGMSVLGCVLAFVAGLLALKWISRWLQTGRWYLFGIYCLVASAVVAGLHFAGY
jgi:undecaprenyl-diphosphatase